MSLTFNPNERSLQQFLSLQDYNSLQNHNTIPSLFQLAFKRFPHRVYFKNKKKLPINSGLCQIFLERYMSLFAEEDRYNGSIPSKITFAKIDQFIKRNFRRTNVNYQRVFFPKINKCVNRQRQKLDPRFNSINDYEKMKQAISDKNLILFAQKLNDEYGFNIPIDNRINDAQVALIIRNWFLSEENQEKINQITQLELCRLNLTEIPKEIKYFKNLEVLNLIWNNITCIQSNVLDNNLELKSLFLNHNKIDYLPNDFLQKNVKLQYLNLLNNNLKVLPENFLRTNIALRFLNLNYNLLTDLPVNFLSNNRQMHFFYFRCNKFNQDFFERRIREFTSIQIEY